MEENIIFIYGSINDIINNLSTYYDTIYFIKLLDLHSFLKPNPFPFQKSKRRQSNHLKKTFKAPFFSTFTHFRRRFKNYKKNRMTAFHFNPIDLLKRNHIKKKKKILKKSCKRYKLHVENRFLMIFETSPWSSTAITWRGRSGMRLERGCVSFVHVRPRGPCGAL